MRDKAVQCKDQIRRRSSMRKIQSFDLLDSILIKKRIYI